MLFVQDIVEGPLRHHLATILACQDLTRTPQDAYLKARNTTGGAVVGSARQKLPSEFTDNVSVIARHSSAHVDYAVQDEGVLLQASLGAGATNMTYEALTDSLLAALETASALQLAVLAACDEEGVLADDSDLLDELDPHLVSKLLLASIGWRNIAIEEEGSLLRITGDSELPSPLPTIGMVISRLNEAISDIELVARTATRTKVLSAKTAPFRRWSARPDPEDEFTSQSLFIDAIAELRFDGASVIDMKTIRHVAAIIAAQAVNEEYAEAVRRLTSLRNWLRRYADADLEKALMGTHRALTSKELGLAFSPEEQAAIDQIGAWITDAAPVTADW